MQIRACFDTNIEIKKIEKFEPEICHPTSSASEDSVNVHQP